MKKVMKNMAICIKTIETVQHRFPTTVLLMLFHALVISHLEYSALCLSNQFNFGAFFGETDKLGFEVCIFRSSISSSNELRKRKNVIGIRQLIELKNLKYYFQYIRNMKRAFQQQFKLPMASYRINKRTNQIIFVGNIPSISSSSKFLFNYVLLKWKSLPLYLRLKVFKSRLKKFLIDETTVVPIQQASTWRDFRFK